MEKLLYKKQRICTLSCEIKNKLICIFEYFVTVATMIEILTGMHSVLRLINLYRCLGLKVSLRVAIR
jgi:hypothetical protein